MISLEAMKINQTYLRLFGIAGMLGGLILFAGDMLFYYDATSTHLKLNMGHASDFRIKASAVSALLGMWFYLLGLGQIYYAFKPSSSIVRNLVLICFAGIFSTYGVVHAAYVAIAATAKLSVTHQLDLETATALASAANDTLRLFAYPLFGLLSFLFIRQVWHNKTLYPRWMIFFFPLIPFLLQGLITGLLSGRVWIVIAGGYLNLILLLFFFGSTVALWNRKDERKT